MQRTKRAEVHRDSLIQNAKSNDVWQQQHTTCTCYRTHIRIRSPNLLETDYLEQSRKLIWGIRFHVQEEEALLGFMTANAVTDDVALHEMVAWDSGGGSFQIAAEDEEDDEVRSWLQHIGSGTVCIFCMIGTSTYAEHVCVCVCVCVCLP
jgi:hypothetical protein